MAFHPERLTGNRRRKYLHSLAWAPAVKKIPATVRARLNCPDDHIKGYARVGADDVDGVVIYHSIVVVRNRIVCLDHPKEARAAADTYAALFQHTEDNGDVKVCRCRVVARKIAGLPITVGTGNYPGCTPTPGSAAVRRRLENRAVQTPRRAKALANHNRHTVNLPIVKTRDEVPAVLHDLRYLPTVRPPAVYRLRPFERHGSCYTQRRELVPAAAHPVPAAPHPAPGKHSDRFAAYANDLPGTLAAFSARFVAALNLCYGKLYPGVETPVPTFSTTNGSDAHVLLGTYARSGPAKPFDIGLDHRSWWVRLGLYGFGMTLSPTGHPYFPIAGAYPTLKPPGYGAAPPPGFAAQAIDMGHLVALLAAKCQNNVTDLTLHVGALGRDTTGTWVFTPVPGEHTEHHYRNGYYILPYRAFVHIP
jgi:hypothetical protein